MIENSKKKILIAGQDKTGTTALFYGIKRALPSSTRCLFEPIEYVSSPRDADRNVLAKVLIREPKLPRIQSFRDFDQRVLTIRDPRDTLVSFVLYSVYHAERHHPKDINDLLILLERKESDPSQVSLCQVMDAVDRLSPNKLSRLDSFCYNLRLYQNFHASADSYHFIRYEDFVSGQVNPLEQYLGFSLGSVVAVPVGVNRVARTKASGNWKNWLVEEDIKTLRPLLDASMQQLGYEDEWKSNSRPHIRSEHGSLYVRRLLAERRKTNSVPRRVLRRLRRSLIGR